MSMTIGGWLGVAPMAGIIQLGLQSDLSGRVILCILFFGSIYLWTLMLSKYMHLKSAENKSQAFLSQYRRLTHPMALLGKTRETSDKTSPLDAIYDQACVALEAVLDVQGVEASSLIASNALAEIPLSDRQIRSVQSATERSVAEQVVMLEANMGGLANGASMAPLLGLLGTVMGVMSAFGNMAGSGTALLSEVAPGIASALVTTVVGLIVALPSAFSYNALSARLRRLTVLMDNFAQELVGDLERVHLS